LVFTIWDITEPSLKVPAGGTTVRLFGPNRTLRKGRQKLAIWEGQEGDGAINTTTQGKLHSSSEIDRIEKVRWYNTLQAWIRSLHNILVD